MIKLTNIKIWKFKFLIFVIAIIFLSACKSKIGINIISITHEKDFDQGTTNVSGEVDEKYTEFFFDNYRDAEALFIIEFHTDMDIVSIVKKRDLSTPTSKVFNCKVGDQGGLFISPIYKSKSNREQSYFFLLPTDFNLVNLSFQSTVPRSTKYWTRTALEENGLCFNISAGSTLGRIIESEPTQIPLNEIADTATFADGAVIK